MAGSLIAAGVGPALADDAASAAAASAPAATASDASAAAAPAASAPAATDASAPAAAAAPAWRHRCVGCCRRFGTGRSRRADRAVLG